METDLLPFLDDGRVIKALNAASAKGDYENKEQGNSMAPIDTVVVSEIQVLRPGTPIKQLHVALFTEKLIIVSNEKVIITSLHNCLNLSCRLAI